MKNQEQFKMDVFDKRDQVLEKRKSRRNRIFFLELPLLLLAVGGVLAVWFLPEASPRSLYAQAANPNPPEDLSLDALYLEQDKAWANDDQEKADALSQKRDDLVEKRQNTLLDPDFPNAVNTLGQNTAASLAETMEENGCFSPLSLYYALALTGSGASGETERAFLEALGAKDQEWLAEQCGKFYRQHYRNNDCGAFLLSNSLWLQQDFPFENDFLKRAENDYFSSLFQADFSDPGIGDAISGWISENTRGLLSPELKFEQDTKLAIVNTAYLKDTWVDLFLSENNTEEPFTREDGSQVSGTFMHRTEETGQVLKGDGFLQSSLPLRNGKMVFVLPNEGVSPKELLADPETFAQMFMENDPQKLHPAEVRWSVPKFSFDSHFDLMDTLRQLGLSDALDPNLADFSGMSPIPLYLTQAEQGVHLGVDENGVEAAAYTLMAAEACAAVSIPEIVEMKLDRPFLFAIYSDDWTEGETGARGTGTLLFVGICGDIE